VFLGLLNYFVSHHVIIDVILIIIMSIEMKSIISSVEVFACYKFGDCFTVLALLRYCSAGIYYSFVFVFLLFPYC